MQKKNRKIPHVEIKELPKLWSPEPVTEKLKRQEGCFLGEARTLVQIVPATLREQIDPQVLKERPELDYDSDAPHKKIQAEILAQQGFGLSRILNELPEDALQQSLNASDAAAQQAHNEKIKERILSEPPKPIMSATMPTPDGGAISVTTIDGVTSYTVVDKDGTVIECEDPAALWVQSKQHIAAAVKKGK
jgi:hypothetical protein